MHSAVRRLLAEDAQLPSLEELETLTLQLRGHIALLIPEVETTAGRLPKDDVPRYCALACVGEARGKLSQQARPGTGGSAAHARRLARVLNALVDHHENLSAS
ncbi:DUF6415 family natural product biosynthesis protein [Streptomyces mirabilis]|uniref:DUF6415 family natural product biosynthesis protein n=1 Tax=Streptomyces mirabilis TaxID=68239 RepID=UPI0037F82DE8